MREMVRPALFPAVGLVGRAGGEKKMTRKHERFIEEYLIDFNGAGAARRAGYKEKSASVTACRLLKDPEIKRVLQEKMAERAEKIQLRQDTVLQELKNVAFADGSDASGAAVKMTSKLKALELLGKHLGLFEGVGGKEPEQVQILEDVLQG